MRPKEVESRGLDNQLHMKDDKEAVSMGHMMAFGLGYCVDGNVTGRRDHGSSLNILSLTCPWEIMGRCLVELEM